MPVSEVLPFRDGRVMIKKAIPITVVVVAILAGNLAWIALGYSPDEKDSSVEILVVDDFESDEFQIEGRFGSAATHGDTVADIAKQWSLGCCKIKTFNAKLGSKRGSGTFLGAQATSRSYHAALVKVARYVMQHPDKKFILNLSLGSGRPNEIEEKLLSALDSRGVIIVAAAGNEGSEEPFYPAAYGNVIAVAASREGKKEKYSNFGGHVALAVDTMKRKHVKEQDVWLDAKLVSIRTEVGTSLSAPKLAGMLALAWDADPEMAREDLLSAMEDSCHSMADDYYRQGKLGKGELGDYSMMFSHARKPKLMTSLLLAELALFLVVHMLFSRRTLILGGITFLLFSVGMLGAFVLCGLANTLMWGYSFMAGAYWLFWALYLLLRSSPHRPKEEIDEMDEPLPGTNGTGYFSIR